MYLVSNFKIIIHLMDLNSICFLRLKYGKKRYYRIVNNNKYGIIDIMKEGGMVKNNQFFRLFIVILFETSLFMLMGSIDTMMLSAYSGEAVNAVSNANQALTVMNMLFSILSTGSIIIIAQYYGAKKIEHAKDVSLISILLSFIFGGILSIIFIIFNDFILTALNVPKHVYQDSKTYSLIVGSILAITATNPVMSSIFRGFHKAKISLYISLIANILNIIGNAIFIFGLFGLPRLGVVGVAYSTVFAIIFRSVVSLILILNYLKIRPSIDFLKRFKSYFTEIFKIGSPSALEGIIYNVMQLVVVSMVNLISDDAMETRTFVLQLSMFVYLGSAALAQTNQIYVGNYIGNHEFDKAFTLTNRTFKMAVMISMAVTLIFNIFNDELLGLFTKNQAIIEQGKTLLLFTFLVEFGRAVNLVYAQAFKGAGAVKFPLYTAFIFMLGTAIPLTYLLGLKLGLGLVGVWIAYAFDELARGAIAIFFWYRKSWTKKRIVK